MTRPVLALTQVEDSDVLDIKLAIIDIAFFKLESLRALDLLLQLTLPG